MSTIYKITNTINNDFYIGKTDILIEQRFKDHKYNARTGSETYFYNAIRKYGESNFIIEKIEENVHKDREIFWIAELNPTYNMTKGGDGGDTSKSEKYKIGIKNYHLNQPAERYATFGMLGKTHSEEVKIKQSNARKEYWKNISDDELNKRKEKTKGKNNPMYGKTPTNAVQIVFEGIKYPSYAAATRATGLSQHNIKRILNYESNSLDRTL